ncbi:MAG: hypothetical protein IPP50_20795 [Piscinibacter sp.]|nr:hypothetical protein [Piscinibacter sp.]
MNDADSQWRKAGDMLRGDKKKMPPVGKYNAGQKMMFWVTALSLLVMLVTGVMFWRPWFAPVFPIAAAAPGRAAALGRGGGSDAVDHHACLRGDLGQGHGPRDDPGHRQPGQAQPRLWHRRREVRAITRPVGARPGAPFESDGAR